ncbi:MAG: hypothetical protein ACFCVD_20270 [Nodosilinea sp.]
MADRPQWLQGATGSGKTAWLIQQLIDWAEQSEPGMLEAGQSALVFAANGDNRIRLAERTAVATQGRFPVVTTTPNGFIQDEVTLFWPLLVNQLGSLPQFPARLRPENEQELAARLWQPQLLTGALQVEGWLEGQIIRRALDFLQLGASAVVPAEDLPVLLPEGIPPGFAPEAVWQALGQAVVAWRDWCLDRSLLTYGVMTELYWRHLLPQPVYQEKLLARYGGVWADDLDEYPAIAAQWLQIFIDQSRPVALTWNPQGKVRLGVGADPDRLAALRAQCRVTDQATPAADSLAFTWADPVVDWVTNPLALPEPVECFQTIQTTSRGELLRLTAETVAAAIAQGQVAAGEVAIIGPGLDAIARYTLAEILTKQGLPVASLNDQRPLINSPLVRALLTLLTFIYPGLGRLTDQDAVAEMLVVLSQTPQAPDVAPWFDTIQIDPVRAELLVDHCFLPHLEQPELLPVERFDRWDRLGYKATQAYTKLLQWIAQQQGQRQKRLVPGVVSVLDRAIQTFFWGGNHLPPDQLTAIRELMETAQHYWTVEDRLRQVELAQGTARPDGQKTAVERFILLLRQGTVTANPFPVESMDGSQGGITIATVFQYRLQRLRHRWHFWLDAGSPRWLTGTDNLFGFPMFLSTYRGRPWRTEDIETLHTERLERILRDLLGRVTERVVLCHSDLAVSGQEQTGPLLTLVSANTAAAEDLHNPDVSI